MKNYGTLEQELFTNDCEGHSDVWLMQIVLRYEKWQGDRKMNSRWKPHYDKKILRETLLFRMYSLADDGDM